MPSGQRASMPSATDSDLLADGISPPAPQPLEPEAGHTPGTLYIVSLPLGDPEDISLRALRVLRSVTLIAAENPPRARTLLAQFQIATPITSYRLRHSAPTSHGPAEASLVGRQSRTGAIPATHHKPQATSYILAVLLGGASVALVCDAGTPLVADAGGQVVRAALAADIPLAVVPGPVAAVAALVLAAVAEQRFAFDGFPPRARTQREAYFPALAAEERTIVLYETRRYLPDTLKRLRDSLGACRSVLIARDLTKSSQNLCHSTLGEAAQQFDNPPSGEYTLVISRAQYLTPNS